MSCLMSLSFPQVRRSEGKGRGVFAKKNFVRGEFLMEYTGELITAAEARVREKRYETDESVGCYLFFSGLKIRIYGDFPCVTVGHHSRN